MSYDVRRDALPHVTAQDIETLELRPTVEASALSLKSSNLALYGLITVGLEKILPQNPTAKAQVFGLLEKALAATASAADRERLAVYEAEMIPGEDKKQLPPLA